MRSAPPVAIAAALVAAFFGPAACSSSIEMPPSKVQLVDAGPTSTYSWHRDVRPIVEAKCAMCHQAGGIAPFTMTYAEAVKHSDGIQQKVASHEMPPWPPAASCNRYQHDRSLTDAQIHVLTDWASGNTPEGNPADYAGKGAVAVAGLSRTDLKLKMATAYQPKLRPDEYRCFLIDWPETTTKYVTGFGVEPGDPAIVHHAIAFLATPDLVAGFQKLDDADPAPGYPCFGGPGGDQTKIGWLGAWVPGALGSDAPPGTGIKVVPGSKVVLQLHYNTLTTPPAPDQTQLDLKLDDKVDKEAYILKFADPKWVTSKTMNIAASMPDVTHAFSIDPSPYFSLITGGVLQDSKPYTIWSAGLHMHTRGTHATLEVDRAGGAKDCALEIDHWNFHWQGAYGLDSPLVVNPGDQLKIECHWDNTARNQPVSADGVPLVPREVNWGETTEDEMCLGTFYVTQ